MWLVLLATLASAITPEEVPSPRHEGRWVVDLADIIDDETEARIDERLQRVHDNLGIEAVLVNIDATSGRTPKQFSTDLFNHWGVGDAERNDGLLVLMVIGERRLEMETGDGLRERLSDHWLKQMQQRTMVPFFKKQQFAEGLEMGLQDVDEYLHTQQRRDRQRAEQQRVANIKQSIEIEPWPDKPVLRQVPFHDTQTTMMVGYGGGTFFALLGGILLFRRRNRTCPDCHVAMGMLDELADDEHLDSGQEKEEQIGSVNYQVYVCPTCPQVRTFRKARWFSGYSSCPSCSYRTRTSSRTTVTAATRYSGGTDRVTEDCRNCSYHNTYTVSTPRLPDPDDNNSSSSGGSSWSSSSSSSSSSGFGGGSSSGGGAGSSW